MHIHTLIDLLRADPSEERQAAIGALRDLLGVGPDAPGGLARWQERDQEQQQTFEERVSSLWHIEPGRAVRLDYAIVKPVSLVENPVEPAPFEVSFPGWRRGGVGGYGTGAFNPDVSFGITRHVMARTLADAIDFVDSRWPCPDWHRELRDQEAE